MQTIKFKSRLATYDLPGVMFRRRGVRGRPIGFQIKKVDIPPKGDGQFFDGIEIRPINQNGDPATTAIRIMAVDIPAFIKAIKQEANGLSKSFPDKLPRGKSNETGSGPGDDD